MKPGRCRKFRSFWQWPFIVVQKLSALNYKIVDKEGKEIVVHINRLKKSYDETPWSFDKTRRPRRKTEQLDTEESLDEHVEIRLRRGYEHEPQIVETQALVEEQKQLDRDPQMPENVETPATEGNRRKHMPDSSAQDPDYEPRILRAVEEG